MIKFTKRFFGRTEKFAKFNFKDALNFDSLLSEDELEI